MSVQWRVSQNVLLTVHSAVIGGMDVGSNRASEVAGAWNSVRSDEAIAHFATPETGRGYSTEHVGQSGNLGACRSDRQH